MGIKTQDMSRADIDVLTSVMRVLILLVPSTLAIRYKTVKPKSLLQQCNFEFKFIFKENIV
jgi:hypothetical protein